MNLALLLYDSFFLFFFTKLYKIWIFSVKTDKWKFKIDILRAYLISNIIR